MPSRCIFFLSALRAWSTLLSRTRTCTRRSFFDRVPRWGGPIQSTRRGCAAAERAASSAADLKFLHRLRQTHFRNFKSKSGTRIICLLVPLLLPKFVSEGAAMYHELRKRGTSRGGLHRPAVYCVFGPDDGASAAFGNGAG